MPSNAEILIHAKKYIEALRSIVKRPAADYLQDTTILYRSLYAGLSGNLYHKDDLGQKVISGLHDKGVSFRILVDTFFKVYEPSPDNQGPEQQFYYNVTQLLDEDLKNALFQREDAALKHFSERVLHDYNPDVSNASFTEFLNNRKLNALAIQAFLTEKKLTHLELNAFFMNDEENSVLWPMIEKAKQLQAKGQTTHFQCLIGTSHVFALDLLFDKNSQNGSCVILDSAEHTFGLSDLLLQKNIKIFKMTSTVPRLPGGVAVLPGEWDSISQATTAFMKQADSNPHFREHLGFTDKCILIKLSGRAGGESAWQAGFLCAAGRGRDMDASSDDPGFSKWEWKELELSADEEQLLDHESAKFHSIPAIIDLNNINEESIQQIIQIIDRVTAGEFFGAIVAQRDNSSCAVMGALMLIEASKCDVHQLCSIYVETHQQDTTGRLGSERFGGEGVQPVPWSVMPPQMLKVTQYKPFYEGHSDVTHPQQQRLLIKYFQSGQDSFVKRSEQKVLESFKKAIQKGDFSFLSYMSEKPSTSVASLSNNNNKK